jgi:tetratricopeptide (TPR) repeat protein
MYLDVVAANGPQACAVEGLKAITTASRTESKLCAEGKLLAEEGKTKAAQRHYVAALRVNAASKCAEAGLTPAPQPEKSEKDKKSWLEQAVDDVTNALKLFGAIAIALLVLVGIGLVFLLFFRRRKASLSIESFSDGGVEPKIGSTVAALVERSLTDLSRRGRRSNDSYVLDLVVADLELMATNKSLETALGGLTETSQLKLVIAVLGLIDRMHGTHLVAKGELAPKGGDGRGLVLALQSESDGLQARGALWKKSRMGPKNPTPYYELAEPAAAWVQYEAARSLDARVALMTTSAKSFSLLSLGLAEHRLGKLDAAAEKYAEALTADRENVAAMFNLSVLLMRDPGWIRSGIFLQIRALAILQKRYEELE